MTSAIMQTSDTFHRMNIIPLCVINTPTLLQRDEWPDACLPKQGIERYVALIHHDYSSSLLKLGQSS
jgi:hypothetical protein